MSAVLAVESAMLPDGWYWTTMGEIAEVLGGGTPRTTDPANFEGGDVPWITPADLSGYTEKYISHGARFITRRGLESSSAQLLPAGTVLFTSRAPIGYVAIARNPLGTNQGFKSFVLKDGVLPEYVYWWLKGSKQRAEALASGTTFLELSGANAKKLPIPVAPLDEQRRIVTELETQLSRLDKAVANLKRVKASLKRYKAAVLKAAVEGQLVPTEAEVARREGRVYETGTCLLERILTDRRAQWQGVGKYKEPPAPSSLKQPVLPEGWALATVEQLNPAHRPCAYGVLQPGADSDSGVPFVRVGDIAEGRVAADSLKRINPSIAARYPRTRLEGGELLVTLVGAIGRSAIAPPILRGSNVARAVAVVPLARQVDPNWVGAWFRNPQKIAEMNSLAHEVARKTLNLEDVRRSVVALPPLAEQRRIGAEVERLISMFEEVETVVNTAMQRAKILRQLVLASAFANGAPSRSLNAIEEARS